MSQSSGLNITLLWDKMHHMKSMLTDRTGTALPGLQSQNLNNKLFTMYENTNELIIGSEITTSIWQNKNEFYIDD